MNNFYQSLDLLPLNPSRLGQGGLRTRGIVKKSSKDTPLISVITIVFNGCDYLEQTIQSVLSQTYKNIEYIIIDGGSTDGSIEIIKKFENKIDYWVSEKDAGISDAFNKGVILSNGEFVNFQGDGDGFIDQDSIQKVVTEVDSDTDWLVCGRIRRVDLNGKVLFESKVRSFNPRDLLFRMALPHQALFTHRKFFEKFGLFDIKNKFCMDYDHLLRAYRDFPKTKILPIVVAQWRDDGLGNGRTLEVLKEYDRIKRKNRVAPPALLCALHIWTLVKFKFKELLIK